MNGRQPISCRYGVFLFLPVFCLTMSACAGGKSVMEAPNEDVARFEESAKELRQLAQRGDASAQNELGLLYYEGKGVPQNHNKAKEWFDKAVEQGHAGAQVNLGTLYLRGEGAPQSSQMALFWFSRAAGQENALAFAKLGLMYSQGRGVLQDFIQAHIFALVFGGPQSVPGRYPVKAQPACGVARALALRYAKHCRPRS